MRRLVILVALVSCAACNDSGLSNSGAEADDSEPNGPGTADDYGACAKIEGADIGVEGLVLVVGTKTIRFHDWSAKNGEPNEFIAFAYDESAPLLVFVKAGGETYDAANGSWVHPSAATDASASAVSNVEVCDPDEPADGGDNDDGNGDPDD